MTQCIASRGPNINPGFISSLILTSLFNKIIHKNIEPINVLIPTSEIELISEVLMIKGIVPQETAKTVMAK